MSLEGYQRALSDLIASPELCLKLRRDENVLNPYDLDQRERFRLKVVVHQAGMSTNCTLYRVNRITPIATLLPLTCFLLGDALILAAERYWEMGRTDLQFQAEVDRFASFLLHELALGELEDPYLGEIVAFESSVNRLQFAFHEELSREPTDEATGLLPRGDERVSTTVMFNHDPQELLAHLVTRTLPKPELVEGRFNLRIEISTKGLTMFLEDCPVVTS